MFRIFVACTCAVAAAGTSSDQTCAAATGAGPCAATLAAGDHSLLQVHPAAPAAATKKHSHSGREPAKAEGTKLQQQDAVQGESAEKESSDGSVDEGLGSGARNEPYPEDYDLDMDYPHDKKGTHADTVREVQSATLPGAGDIGRSTKPGRSDSWNVDTMFASDSDGEGDVSLRGMIPWGYRTQGAAKKESKNDKKGEDDDSGLLSAGEKAHEKQNKDDKKSEEENSGLLSQGESANEERDGKMGHDNEATNSQRHRKTQASKSKASESTPEAAPKSHHKQAPAQDVPASAEAKGTAPAARRCAEGQE